VSAPPEPGVLASVGAALAQAVFRAADVLYGPSTIAGVPVPLFALLLFGIGLFLTVRFRLVQVAHFRQAARSFRRGASDGQGC